MPTTPQDHKLPKPHARPVTVRGVTFQVDPDVFDDLDVLEWLWDIQTAEEGGDALAMIPFLRRVCGPAWRKVKDALRDPDTGRVPVESVKELMGEVMKQVAPNS